MTTNCNYLALDLGAESGRASLGVLDDGWLNLQEVRRFGNSPVRLPDGFTGMSCAYGKKSKLAWQLP